MKKGVHLEKKKTRFIFKNKQLKYSSSLTTNFQAKTVVIKAKKSVA